MTRIDDPARAERLARAILADVMLYNDAEITAHSPKVNDALQEGRELYQQRVDPSLFGLFEKAVSESRLAPWGAATGEAYRAPPFEAPPPPRERNTTVPVFVAIVVLAVAAALMFILAGDHR